MKSVSPPILLRIFTICSYQRVYKYSYTWVYSPVMNAHTEHKAQGNPVVGDNLSGVMLLRDRHSAHAYERGGEQAPFLYSRQEPGTETFTALKATEQELKSEFHKGVCGVSNRREGAVEATVCQPDAGATSTYVAETQVASAYSSWSDHLTAAEIANLNVVFDQDMAPNTMTNYRAEWNNFVSWTSEKGIRALPADPAQVATYLAERMEQHGHRPATLRVAASAITFVHRNASLADPCTSLEVKKTLRCATRKAGKHQKQAEALTADAMADIESTACEPRLGRDGRLESRETARRRGNLDIALISLMRDAMLRVSEAAVLTWKDIETEADGTGRLLIRCSKTDADGQGSVAFLSPQTMAALELIRNEAGQDVSVFGLRPNQMANRIKKAALAAGLGEGFSGHSPRVGMARDLARAGIELPSLMNAGRWRSATMPAHYIRNETAARGAVAQFHGYCRVGVR